MLNAPTTRWIKIVLIVTLSLVVWYRLYRPDATPGTDVARPATNETVPGSPPGRPSLPADDPNEAIRAQIASDLLPRLYASNDIDALITGAIMTLGIQEGPYQVDDFIESGLSLAPNDPLLLAFQAVYCEGAAESMRVHQGLPPTPAWMPDIPLPDSRTAPVCQTSYLDNLTRVVDDNAWLWAMRARAAQDPTRRLEYLQRLTRAPWYSDYGTETRILMTSSLHRYAEEDADAVILDGIGRLAGIASVRSGFQRLCSPEAMTSGGGYLAGCRKLGGYLADSSTLAGQMTGVAILDNAYRIAGETPPPRPPLLREQTIGAWMQGVAAGDSPMYRRFRDNLARYTEVDAMKEALIHHGVMEDDGQALQEITIRSDE